MSWRWLSSVATYGRRRHQDQVPIARANLLLVAVDLRDGLEAVSAEIVQLKLINRLRPGLIEAPDESFWYLIMPIRLAG